MSELYPFKSNWFDLDGVRMHYLDEGQGDEVLVMVHGNPTWSFFYRDLVKAFSATHRVIVPDHIGMGYSDKPQDYAYTLATHISNIEKLLGSLLNGNEKVTMVVHDWGGAIGMGWAVRHPEMIKRLVVFNTAAFLSSRIPFRINICRIPLFGDIAIRGFNAFAGAATFMTTATPMPTEVKQMFVKPYSNWHDRISVLRFVQDIPMHPSAPSYPVVKDIEDKLEQFKDLPVLVQWGGQDWCFNNSFYHEWLRRFPEASADYYEDAGHYLLEDKGEQITSRMKTFFSENPV